ncbi:tail fiber domain-containing protein [Flavobacteriales bacterium]|nr:tail fiber domain-containing protein [Flavobacteriales bacterium]
MKNKLKIYCLTALLSVTSLMGYAQAPNASSLVRLHNVTTNQMNGISNPLTGSLVYNTSQNSVYQRSSNAWVKLRQTLSINGDQLSISDGNTVSIPSLNIANGTQATNSLYCNGTDWVENEILTIHLPGVSQYAGASGRVGINTQTPDQTLSVNGNASKTGGGAWLTFSDRRVKKNIVSYHKGIEEVMQIKPVSFQYNSLSGYEDTTSQFVGVIAQEIERLLPNTVSQFDDSQGASGFSDKRTFDSSEIIWLLVNAVKDLDKKNKELLRRLDERR